MELVLFLLLVAVLPSLLAWCAGKLLRTRSRLAFFIITVLAAGIPSFWFLWATQQADGITRAASIMVSPVLFVIALIPAGIGLALSQDGKCQ